jgi:hypothetical protein
VERATNIYKERGEKDTKREYIEIHTVIPLPLYERAREVAPLIRNGDRRRWTFLVDEAFHYILSQPAIPDIESQETHVRKVNSNSKDVHLKIDPSLWNEARRRFWWFIYPSGYGASKLITWALREYLSSLDTDALKRETERRKRRRKDLNVEKKFTAVLTALRSMGLTIYTGSQVGELTFNEAMERAGIKSKNTRSFWKRRFEKYGFIEIENGFKGKRNITIMKTFDTQADGDCPLYSYRDPVQRIIHAIYDVIKDNHLPSSLPRVLFEKALNKCGFYAPSTIRKYIRMMKGRGLIKHADRRSVVFWE